MYDQQIVHINVAFDIFEAKIQEETGKLNSAPPRILLQDIIKKEIVIPLQPVFPETLLNKMLPIM